MTSTHMYTETSTWWEGDCPAFMIDFYKVGHVNQYIKGIKRIWVNFTPRSTRVEGETGVIFFGLQRYIKRNLIDLWNRYFFSVPWDEFETKYKEVIRKTLGVQNPRTDHIKQLWEHGKLPIDIYALPEGTYVPLGVPAMVIVNNEDWAFWLPNYLETTTSANLWIACTSASTAHRYRRLFIKHAIEAGEKDLFFVNYQGHDFSYRGMEGEEGARLSGLGHLLSFSGTDTVPAILDAVKYYNADYTVGGSVPATEHSVMCAGSQEGEQETFRRLIEDEYKTGIVSIVSDTWNLWDVLTKIIPNLKPQILARQPNGPVPAKVVIRPDSGDPVEILTGTCAHLLLDPTSNTSIGDPKAWGALRLLARALGVTPGPGGWTINKAGLIYGDSITVERADKILFRGRLQGFSPFNFVFGIGSYTYQYVTRDTYNFAFKATAIETETGVQAIFKDPVTDNAHKKSHRGIPAVYLGRMGQGTVTGKLYVEETLNPADLDRGELRKVFNGDLLIDEDFESIRTRVRTRDYIDVSKWIN